MNLRRNSSIKQLSMFKRHLVSCAATASLLPGAVCAHHGLDFISVQTAHLPVQGAGYAIGRVDYISEEEDEMEFEPALLYGATDWLTFELHAHFEKESGESANYESLAPALNFRLTPREQQFSFGVSVEYEFAHDSAEEDVLGLTAMLGYEFSEWLAAVNVLFENPSGSSGEWEYAAGVRHRFNDDHAFGLELNGSLESGGSSQALIGYYGELSKRFSLNAGIGVGIDGGPDWSVRTAFIWQFK
jgi:hypothetical protein